MSPLSAPLPLGDLIDRITILEIKRARIAAPGKRRAVTRELAALTAIAAPYLAAHAGLAGLKRRLAWINKTLWVCEERSRQRLRRAPAAESAAPLLARIARFNDARFRVKQKISRLAADGMAEQKSYG
ncbi:MAG: hypothetical protein AB7L65_02915 [Hyphomonadaceae bacterium]